MRLDHFEKLTSKHNQDIVERFEYMGCTVIVTDGYQEKTQSVPYPHFRTEWAMGRSIDKLDIMQPLQYEAFKDKLGYKDKRPERVKEARKQAKQFIRGCSRQEHYDG